MSIAGIRSNRGDGYQTLVAFDWALTVLSDPDYEWIEVDSVSYEVDDVVIGKSDGSLICCQCKKNQTHFKAWTIADLGDEMHKAARLLANNQKVEVRFYSRNPFGALAKLREHSTTQADEAGYRTSLSQKHQKTDASLASLLATHAPNLSTYEFLCRTIFESTSELDRLVTLLRERLRVMACKPDTAFDVLWSRLDVLGARMDGSSISASAQHRLTKNDLRSVLDQAGVMLVPPMVLAEVRTSFASASAIGRSWHRDIAGQRIPNTVVNDLLSAIDSRKRSILLTGLPGSGKTCVMLDLQEALEQRSQTQSNMVPLFIQAREFADFATTQERLDQGLPEQWVEKAARMAEDAQVIVVIDSLDVLSIAREHSVLTYFLAQIDRLLLIPDITVVTACRDFDRHYDRRIAERQWDCELICQPLNWDTEIVPLLDTLGIHTTTIDIVTRELIQNPRELTLFVELAQREGSFNVVTSQALAQRYLDSIVRANDALGETAIQAIETIADEMLRSRSLAVAHQRFPATQDIQRMLCSLNVLQETQDGKLTFGHQTLLDVLVISRAVRRGVTLNQFIQDLPPVPFVRPSIRSFVSQLAMGDRRDFRKKLRAVLTGNVAFHIRRLVAESFAEQIPQDDDWPLIRDLREKHRDVYQVIYTQAGLIEWHYFWLNHLVPALKNTQDTDGLTTHMHRVSQWKNEDPEGVLRFWTDMLSLDWLDGEQLVTQLPLYFSEIDPEYSGLTAPLIEHFIAMPRQKHSFLGRAIARCVTAGSVDDELLWRYIAGDINDEDVLAYHFDDKLLTQAREFGNSNNTFLLQRMGESSILLDLAVGSIEQWSEMKSSKYGKTGIGYRNRFLRETSYNDTHSQDNLRHISNERALLDTIESAILDHAKTDSHWWQENRERLCFNHEGALLYFAIIACTKYPKNNTDLIGRVLSNKEILEFELGYELGLLLRSAFIYLDTAKQDLVTASILSAGEENLSDERERSWELKRRVKLVTTIPCHLRSPEAQDLLNAYEKTEGTVIHYPHTMSRGGIVRAPFSFEVFLNSSDAGVLRLLAHYTGDERNFDDFLVGGEREVGWQLSEAASRHPERFLQLLSTHWGNISESFYDDIMDGVAKYLNYRFGSLQANGTWTPVDEPDAPALASHIIEELERQTKHWHHNRSASKALEACANVIEDTAGAARLVSLAIGFANLQEESTIEGDSVDLINMGINMVGGNISEALMILANNSLENSTPFPELLSPALYRFAGNRHPAIRALILQRLPYIQSKNSVLGWELFALAMQDSTGLWQSAERCLYYAYHNHFERVAPLLERIRHDGNGKDLETWGRISALSALSKQIDFTVFMEELMALDSSEAWEGAASVWVNSGNIKQHQDQCLTGIEAGIKECNAHALVVAVKMEHIFSDDKPIISIPIDLIQRCFTVFERDSENKHNRLFGFHEWLSATANSDPEQALAAIEIYLVYVSREKTYLYDHENRLTQLMTRLFAEAEEREESDRGEMLKRVVAVQDLLLSLGLDSINDWLKAAERP